MATRFFSLATLVSLLALAACQSAGSTLSTATPIRAGRDLPARFEPPAAYIRIAPADTISGAACLSPMRDPRDGAELRMVRSSSRQADYSVPAGRYGTSESELPRVDCHTGEPLGLVPTEE